jgi:AHBA synthesis associated protein
MTGGLGNAAPARQLVIFDLDGTLIDSRRVMTSSFRLAYEKTGGSGEAPVEGFLRRLGQPFPDILAALGLPAEMYEIFRRLSSARVSDIEIVRDGIAACHRLRELGVEAVLITGKDRERTEQILDYLAIGDLFCGLSAGDDDVAGKPSPDGVLALCRERGVTPDQAIVVGDSWVDIAAGISAGTHTVACGWGMGSKAELHQVGPDAYLADPSELTSYLEGVIEALRLRTPFAVGSASGEPTW